MCEPHALVHESATEKLCRVAKRNEGDGEREGRGRQERGVNGREFIITSRGQQGSLCSDALFKSENPPRRAFKCRRFVIPLNTARCRRY